MIEDFSPQPYPLWATLVRDGTEEAAVALVVGWHQAAEMRPGVLLPVLALGSWTYPARERDAVSYSLTEREAHANGRVLTEALSQDRIGRASSTGGNRAHRPPRY